MRGSAFVFGALVLILLIFTTFSLLTASTKTSIDIYEQERVRLLVDNVIATLSTQIKNLYTRQVESIIRWYDWNALLLNLSTPEKRYELFKHVHYAVLWGIPPEDYETVLNITQNVKILIPPPKIEGVLPELRRTIESVKNTSKIYIEVQIVLYNYTSKKEIVLPLNSPLWYNISPAEIIVFPLNKTDLGILQHGPGPGWYSLFGLTDPLYKDVNYTYDRFYVCYPTTVIYARGVGGGIIYERKYVVEGDCIEYDIGIYKQTMTT